MQVIRRLYLYGASFGFLLFLVDGVVGLLSDILQVSFEGLVGPPVSLGSGFAASARDVTVWASSIGLFGWCLHWWLAEWFVERDHSRDAGERSSVFRKLYLYLVILFGGLFEVTVADELIDVYLRISGGRLTATNVMAGDVVSTLASLVIYGAFWLYHVGIVRRDHALAPEAGAGRVVRRGYVYALNFMLGVHSVMAVLQMLGQLSGGANPQSGPVLGSGTEGSLAPTITAILVWIGIRYLDGTGLPSWLWRSGESGPGQMTRTRRLVAVLIIFGCALFTAPQIGFTLASLWRGLTGTATAEGAGFVTDLVPRLAQVGFFGVIWYFQARLLWRDARDREPRQPTTAWQVATYGVCLFALGEYWVGMGGTLETIASPPAAVSTVESTSPAADLPIWISLALTGAGLWALHWWLAKRERGGSSLVRRFYLLVAIAFMMLMLAGTVVSTLVATATAGAGSPAAFAAQMSGTISLLHGSIVLIIHIGWLVLDVRRSFRTASSPSWDRMDR
jgi:hypothetical protein